MRSMAFLTFRGGIHPYDGKDLSKNCPVEKYLPKGDLAILVSQHIGAPAKPIVKKGDHVLAGQKIAEAGGFVSAPIHSSVSGTVKGIEKRLTAVGAMGDAIIIENDGLYESVEYAPAKLSDLSKEDILKRIQEGGVVGQGGAGFPTHVKLSPKEPDKIDHILVNGAECEPYITSDYRRMMEEPESIVGGLEVILKAFPKAVGCICIEDNKPDCIARMKEAIKGKERMEVKELKTKYPQGGERTLIYAVTGREINSMYRAIQRQEGTGAPQHHPDVAISGRQLRFRRWLSCDLVGYCEIATSACGLLAMTNLGGLRHRSNAAHAASLHGGH